MQQPQSIFTTLLFPFHSACRNSTQAYTSCIFICCMAQLLRKYSGTHIEITGH